MKFVGRLHKHTNDCWCDALALATGKNYDEVYASLSPWLIAREVYMRILPLPY